MLISSYIFDSSILSSVSAKVSFPLVDLYALFTKFLPYGPIAHSTLYFMFNNPLVLEYSGIFFISIYFCRFLFRYSATTRSFTKMITLGGSRLSSTSLFNNFINFFTLLLTDFTFYSSVASSS